jgi:putative chitinase
MIDRGIFFAEVRKNPFPGSLTQQQVDGMNGILDSFEADYQWPDLRWLANMLAQSKWETSSTMWPVEEYGKGGDADYAQPDPTTKQCYWGRGLLQLTWASNYQKADSKMGWTKEEGTSCYWNPDLQLKIEWSAPTAFRGMEEGWFRSSGGTPNNLAKYFNQDRDDPFEAREIVNGDKNKVPSWSSGAPVGQLITADHKAFLAALEKSQVQPAPGEAIVQVIISAPPGVRIEVQVIDNDDPATVA